MKKFLMIFLTVCMVVSCMIVPSFAVSYPEPPACPDGGVVLVYHHIGDESDLRCAVYYPLSGQNVDVVRSLSSDSVVVSNIGTVESYNINDSGVWYKYATNSKYSTNEIGCVSWVFDYSTADIYDTSGDLFFPPALPLGETVEVLTMEQSMAVQNQTVGVMKILVPCGVGCLALLMVFPMLRKGFLRFLSR